MTSYATVEEYRTDTNDHESDEAQIESLLDQKSEQLRETVGITDDRVLTKGQLKMCRAIVTEVCGRALAKPLSQVVGDTTGLTQGSFSANGFSATFQKRAAFFDTHMLSALMRSLGTAHGVGTIVPSYGRL